MVSFLKGKNDSTGLRPKRFCTSQVSELYRATGSPRVEVSMEEALTLKESGTASLYSLVRSGCIKERE